MRRFRKAFEPMVWAHRGARSLATENTLAAARKALEVGVDGIITDFPQKLRELLLCRES